MKKFACLAVLAACLPAAAWADCEYPKTLGKMPDGNTATRDEMVAAKKQVDAYNAAINPYLECIKAEADAAVAKQDPAPTEEQKQQITARFVQKNDAAVDELQDVAARFNEQLRAFKARPAK
jgi:opacity protein-like surface antigen